MPFHNVLVSIGLVIILLVVVALRWLFRKVRLRRGWAAIKAEREENKQAFARLAVQLAEFERQWRPSGKSLHPPSADRAPAETARAQQPLIVPAFPDQRWQSVVASGTAAMMRPEQRREIEDLYVDLARLRSCTVELSTATAVAAAEIQRVAAVHSALRALLAEMHRFQPLHTDFDAVLPIEPVAPAV